MSTISQNLQSIIDTKAAIKSAIENVTGEKQSEVFSSYPEKIDGMADTNDSLTYFNTVNGKWVKPDEWDDIESMELDNEHDTIYLLYKLVDERFKYSCLLIGHISSASINVSYGHVSNGVYSIHESCTPQTLTGGTSHTLAYNFSELQDDYIVIRIQSSSLNQITRVSTSDTTANTFPGTDMNFVITYTLNPCLMRYGNMPSGTNLGFRCYTLESDNIIDFAKYFWNNAQTITVTDAYRGNYKMQRWRKVGWDLTKNMVTSFSGLFYACLLLNDINNDFSGWVTNNTTTIASMFNSCPKLKGPINVSGWDLSNVTTLSGLFGYCRSLTKLIGLDTWVGGSKCTSLDNMFYECRLLKQDINLSRLDIGKGNITSIAISSFMTYSGVTSINISGWDLSKATGGLSFSNCNFLTKIITTNTILPKYKNCNETFYDDDCLEEISLTGFDCKTNAIASGTFYRYLAYSAANLRRCEFKNSLFPDNIAIADTSASYGYLFYGCSTLEYLDVRDMDFSVFTGTYTHLYAFRNCYKLSEFYPPKNISKNLNITGDYSLTHESLQRIIANLVDLSGQTSQKVIMGVYNIAKLTQEDMDAMAAKNWTYSAS